MLSLVAGLRGVTLFWSKTKKKVLAVKLVGFWSKRLETKQNEKTRSSPQISGVMVLQHNMVSSGAGRPLSDATDFTEQFLFRIHSISKLEDRGFLTRVRGFIAGGSRDVSGKQNFHRFMKTFFLFFFF